jgi:hypothetical protein
MMILRIPVWYGKSNRSDTPKLPPNVIPSTISTNPPNRRRRSLRLCGGPDSLRATSSPPRNRRPEASVIAAKTPVGICNITAQNTIRVPKAPSARTAQATAVPTLLRSGTIARKRVETLGSITHSNSAAITATLTGTAYSEMSAATSSRSATPPKKLPARTMTARALRRREPLAREGITTTSVTKQANNPSRRVSSASTIYGPSLSVRLRTHGTRPDPGPTRSRSKALCPDLVVTAISNYASLCMQKTPRPYHDHAGRAHGSTAGVGR